MYQSILPRFNYKCLKIDDGSLIEAPKHCKKISDRCVAFYKSIIEKEGFHKCPCGYTTIVSKGNTYTCMKISTLYDRNSIKKYEDSLNNPVLTQAQVQNIIEFEFANENHVSESKLFLEKAKLILHDARQMNTEIKYKAENLSDHITKITKESKKRNVCDEALDESLKIWHNSNMIVNLYSMIDVFLNPASASYGSKTKCDIFNKFYKIKKMMEYKLKDRNIDIVMHNHLDKANIEVYQSFDQVPFIILDNAIKYSEENSKIEIYFEQKGQYIHVTTISVGPLVKDEELEKIFENQYRGQNAIKATSQGSGIGLYLAKTICDVSGLKIYAQSLPINNQGKYTNRAFFHIIIEALRVYN